MITGLKVRGFKCLGESSGEILFRPITVLVGANSSGKSSYIQTLLMLKQTVESRDMDSALITNSNLVSVGAYQDFVQSHRSNAAISVSLSFFPSGGPGRKLMEAPEWYVPKGTYRYDITFRELSNHRIVVSSLALSSSEGEIWSATYDGYGCYIVRANSIVLNSSDGRKAYRPEKFFGFPMPAIPRGSNEAYFSTVVYMKNVIERAFEVCFRKIYYIGPLREQPRRFYVAAGDKPEDVGLRGERAADVLLTAGTDLNRRVDHWLRRFGLASRIVMERIGGTSHYYVKIEDPETGVQAHVTDVGFGVSQLLPLVVATFYSPKGSTIILEQPEIHLHPRVQADFADMIIEQSESRSFVVETHSEHFLTRLQRRVAERRLCPNDVAVYYCTKGEEGTRLRQLIVEETGHLDQWPRDLFGDSLEDHYQMMLAAAQKNRVSQ